MTHKLAKQLKDAGFPFKTTDFRVDKVEGAFFLDGPYGKGYLPPTLSELIEVCGDRFNHLRKCNGKYKDIFVAEGEHKKGYGVFPVGSQPRGEGKTPEEAVAKLWLKLNKK